MGHFPKFGHICDPFWQISLIAQKYYVGLIEHIFLFVYDMIL